MLKSEFLIYCDDKLTSVGIHGIFIYKQTDMYVSMYLRKLAYRQERKRKYSDA